ncbi:helix-turn-helix domain-containing protein [Cohaesibacter celericrescens]|uniref:helix-turn-helix domain-containing protein n=1 Tax=Cohaesibacter celericrescens TaxID=2067669 RepID=UPI00356359EF
MDDIQNILARNVHQARQEKGTSQEDLAGLPGIDRTYVSGIERGIRNPSTKIVAKIADVLRIAPSDLLVL